MNGRRLRWMGILASLPLVCGIAAAQTLDIVDQNTQPVIDPANPADLQFDEMNFDFGKISDDESVEHTFTFTNKGKGTLVISNAKGSCSCTVPALAKKSYQPGESGEIKVIFNPKSKAGSQHQTVTITSNDADTPVMMLNIGAYVRPLVVVEPRVGHFGEVEKDQVATLELTVTGRNADFEVLGAEVDPSDEFTVVVGKTVEVELPLVEDPHAGDLHAEAAGEPQQPAQDDKPVETEKVRQCKITLTMLPGQEIGFIRRKSLTITTNDPKHKEVQVELMAQHKGDLDMSPRRVTLGALAPHEQFHREVTIRSTSGTPFKVLGIDHVAVAEGAMDYAFSPVDPANPTAYIIEIDGEMPSDTNTLRGRFTIRTDVDREEEMTLYYYAQLRREAAPATAGQ